MTTGLVRRHVQHSQYIALNDIDEVSNASFIVYMHWVHYTQVASGIYGQWRSGIDETRG